MVVNVNNSPREVADEAPERPLLGVLRDELQLTGTKYGCGEGQCGACTVLIDGVATRSCITPVASVRAAPVITIEGLARDGALHPVQQAFLDEGAFQCGYCTPGMIMSCAGCLQHTPHPTEAQAVTALNGNLCRCGGYPRIVRALLRAAEITPEARP